MTEEEVLRKLEAFKTVVLKIKEENNQLKQNQQNSEEFKEKLTLLLTDIEDVLKPGT